MRLVARPQILRFFAKICIPGLLLVGASDCVAQSAKKLFLKMGEINKPQNGSTDLSSIESQSLIPSAGTGSKGSGMFDSYYVENLKRSGEQAMMGGRPSEIDPRQTSLVARKALLMNGTNSFHNNMLNSEFRSDYKSLLKTFSTIKEKLQFSVSENSNGEIDFVQKPKGRKILEFGIQPDLGLKCQPYVKIMENTRLRYDPQNQRAIFEVKANW